MPTPKWMEAGTSATFGLEFYASTTGSVSSDSGTVHGQPRSLKTAALGQAKSLDGILNDAGRRFTVYLNPSSISLNPGPDLFVLWNSSTSKPVAILRIRNTADGTLSLTLSNDTFNGTHAVSAAAFGRVSIAYTITSLTVNEFRVYVGGVLDITASNVVLTSGFSQASQIIFGDGNNGSLTTYYSDIYVDDGSDLSDTGDIRVTAKLPTTTNANNFDTTVGTGAVNERPLSETNGKEDTSVLGHQQNYTLQTASAGDVDVSAAVLVARSAWIWSKVSAASVAASIMDNGAQTAVALTTTSALYTLLTASASYPSNAAGIGMLSSTTPNTFLYECGTLIAYTPASPVDFPEGAAILRSRMRTW